MKDKLTKLIIEAPQTPCVIGGQASGRTFQTAENIAEYLIANGVTIPVRCSYCDPDSQDYNPCWLCKKGGTAHDVEHCHKTNYGDYEPMQPHCHLCGRKL